MTDHEWTSFTPIRGVADIAALEAIPIEQRITSWDITDWIWRGCRAERSKIALTYYPAGDPTDPADTRTYGELEADVTAVANLFHTLGVRSGDAVLLLSPTVPDAYTVVLAALARGIICCVNWMLNPEHCVELIRASGAKVLVALGPTPGYAIWESVQKIRDQIPQQTHVLSLGVPGAHSDLRHRSASQPRDRLLFDPARAADEVVAYVHSGGTTGAPKLVRLTSRGIVHKSWSVVTTMAHRPHDILFSDMPMFHIAGLLSCAIMPVIMGSSLVIPTPMGARDKTFIANFWKFVERCRITFLHAVPTTLGTLAQNPPTTEDISSLRDYATTGSTALPVDVARSIEARLGIRLLMTYGATEFTQNVTQAPRDGDPRYGCAGIRNPDTTIRIVQMDASGHILRDCAVDEIGAVLVKSPGNTPGYVNAPSNAGLYVEDGWINNGDLGRLDAEGYLWLTGRARDLIIRGGHNIDPSIIEDALRRHPSVTLAAAVGKPDPYAGELPIAYVQLRDGATTTEAELKAFARAEVSERAAAPADVHIMARIPLTDVGKVAKAELRHEAIRRVFTDRLRGVIGEDIAVMVGPDPVHGVAATIVLPAGSDAMARQAAEAVRGFTVKLIIVMS